MSYLIFRNLEKIDNEMQSLDKKRRTLRDELTTTDRKIEKLQSSKDDVLLKEFLRFLRILIHQKESLIRDLMSPFNPTPQTK